VVGSEDPTNWKSVSKMMVRHGPHAPDRTRHARRIHELFWRTSIAAKQCIYVMRNNSRIGDHPAVSTNPHDPWTKVLKVVHPPVHGARKKSLHFTLLVRAWWEA
jgi:hypothetical protein